MIEYSNQLDLRIELQRQYYCYKINPRLKRQFLQELLTLPIPGVILIDQNLFRDQIITTKEVMTYIANHMDFSYLGLMSQRRSIRGQKFNMKEYISYQTGKTESKIQEGSLVLFILDGTTYVVKSIDSVKKQAIILNNQANIMMRVPLETLKFTDKRGS